MFKVNLLSDGVAISNGPVIESSFLEDEGNKSSSKLPKILTLAALLCLVSGGTYWFLSQQSIVEAPVAPPQITKEKLKAPEKTTKPTGPVAAVAVEETVKEVPVVAQVAPAAPGPNYPGEDLYGQRIAIAQMLRGLLKVSSEGIGFASVVLQAPNYYYVHGLSPTQKEYKSFKSGLKKLSKVQKVTKEEDKGVSAKAKEFTLYGKYRVDGTKMSKNSKLDFKKSHPETIEKLKVIAKQSGLKVKNFVDLPKKQSGKYSRGVVRFQFESSYKGLFPFVKKLKDSKLPLGILQLSLKSTPEENMVGVFDLVLYSK